MYSTEIASFLGSLQKISVDEYMLYSVVLLQGCGLMYKVIMWRLGCKRNGIEKRRHHHQVTTMWKNNLIHKPIE